MPSAGSGAPIRTGIDKEMNMSELPLAEQTRLLALDEGRRAEADRMLADSGLGEIIRAAGFRAVGSYVMRTMTWRDLDFERVEDPPDWDRHWALGARLAGNAWVWRFSCIDAYRDPRGLGEKGLYWGLRAASPAGGPIWKLDLWSARSDEFERSSHRRAEWMRKLTQDARLRILAIKEAVCASPEYRHDVLSVHIYEAVLEHGVCSIADFRDWWTKAHGGRS
jgi:hypothetical protein